MRCVRTGQNAREWERARPLSQSWYSHEAGQLHLGRGASNRLTWSAHRFLRLLKSVELVHLL